MMQSQDQNGNQNRQDWVHCVGTGVEQDNQP